jgi:excisionase family DNA binding protein
MAAAKKLSIMPPPEKTVDVSSIDPATEPIWGVADVMIELGCSRAYVYYLIKNEGLPHDKFGREYRFYRTLVRRWLVGRQKVI